MAYRVFKSPDGRIWNAWDVPGAGNGPHGLPSREAGLLNGWLCFETEGEKRRLAPIPLRWADRSEDELWLYCRVAEVAQPVKLVPDADGRDASNQERASGSAPSAEITRSR